MAPEGCSVGKSLLTRTRAFTSQLLCEHFVYVPISIRAFVYLCPNYSIRKSLFMRLCAFMFLHTGIWKIHTRCFLSQAVYEEYLQVFVYAHTHTGFKCSQLEYETCCFHTIKKIIELLVHAHTRIYETYLHVAFTNTNKNIHIKFKFIHRYFELIHNNDMSQWHTYIHTLWHTHTHTHTHTHKQVHLMRVAD